MKTLLISLLIAGSILQTSTTNTEKLWKFKLTHSLDFVTTVKDTNTIKYAHFMFKNAKYSHISDWEHIYFKTSEEVLQFRNDLAAAWNKRGSTTKSEWKRDNYSINVGGSGISKWNIWIWSNDLKYCFLGRKKMHESLQAALTTASQKF